VKISFDSLKKLFCCNSKIKKQKKPIDDRIEAVYLNNMPVERFCMINANHSRIRSTDVLDFKSMIKWNGYLGDKK